MKQVHDLEYPSCLEECDVCMSMLLSGEANKRLIDCNIPETGLAISKIFHRPHICTLGRMKQIEKLFRGRKISRELYDAWMECNGGCYQIGGSSKLMYMWRDRLLELSKNNDENRRVEIDKDKIIDFNIDNITIPNNIMTIYNHHKYSSVKYIKLLGKSSNFKSRQYIKAINKLFPFVADADKKKSNIDFATTLNAMRNNFKLLEINKLLSYIPIGTFNSMATALTLHYFGNNRAHKMFKLMRSDGVNILKPLVLGKYLKAISTAIRRTQMWPDGTKADLDDITQCSYWEMCTGRSNQLSDWDAEYRHRIIESLPLKLPHNRNRNQESDERYRELLMVELRDIISELITPSIKWTNWHDFVEDRQTWLSGGSSGGEHILFNNKQISVDKRTLFETLTTEEIMKWLDEEPKIDSVASEKYEVSKARAIYGTKVKDYTIMSYAIGKVEPHLHNIIGVEGGLVGIDELRCVLRRAEAMSNGMTECSMLDYADFNRQHTLDAQGMVFDAMAERMTELGINSDAIKASKWCAAALRNQWVKFPHKARSMKVIQGLFSGVRGTNFINTILNVGYYRVARTYVNKHLGFEEDEVWNLHQGDDVWLSSNSRLLNIVQFTVLKACGFDISDKKQMQSVCTGEFLRVLYHKDGCKGFLARSMGTLIERPLQAEQDVAPQSRAVGINSQLNILLRRGLSKEVTTLIWKETMRFQLTSRIGADECSRISINLAERSRLDGGLDIGPPFTLAEKDVCLPKLPMLKYESPVMYKQIPTHTTDAWIRLVSRRYGDKMQVDRLRQALHKANIAGSIPASDKLKARKVLHKELDEWNDIVSKNCKLKSNVRNVENFKKWLNETAMCETTLDFIDEIFYSKKIKRDENIMSSQLKSVFTNIASSPWKDMHNAKLALGLTTIECAKACVIAGKNINTRTESLQYICDLEDRLGIPITNSILEGETAGSSAFQCIFNPIPLSVLTKFSLELAIIQATLLNIRDFYKWRELLQSTQLRVMATAAKDMRLLGISKY